MMKQSAGYTPCHFLCMQRYPNISLVRHLSMHDLKAFSIRVSNDFNDFNVNALQPASRYSENMELLKILLQTDHSMSKSDLPLVYLCERSASQFPTFNKMLECLIAANSSNAVINEGLKSCFQSYGSLHSRDTNNITTLLGVTNLLLEVNGIEGYNTSIFRSACVYLKGEMCIAVLRLLTGKYNEGAGLRAIDELGNLPIHIAVKESTLDVVVYLLDTYPELVNMITEDGNNLLHLALF
jgi:hypothetical protein